jgi:uncharacterized protein YxjI
MPSSERGNHGSVDRTQDAFAVPREPRDRHSKFLVREARLPVGDDYVIELDPGGRVFDVDGRFLRLRESLTIKDVDGTEVYHVQGTLLGAKNVLALSRQGVTIATVRRRTPESGPETYVVELPGSERVEVIGSPEDRAYSLSYDGCIVATISHGLMPHSSSYRVQIAPEQDDGVVLAVTVCLDVMSRP